MTKWPRKKDAPGGRKSEVGVNPRLYLQGVEEPIQSLDVQMLLYPRPPNQGMMTRCVSGAFPLTSCRSTASSQITSSTLKRENDLSRHVYQAYFFEDPRTSKKFLFIIGGCIQGNPLHREKWSGFSHHKFITILMTDTPKGRGRSSIRPVRLLRESGMPLLVSVITGAIRSKRFCTLNHCGVW